MHELNHKKTHKHKERQRWTKNYKNLEKRKGKKKKRT